MNHFVGCNKKVKVKQKMKKMKNKSKNRNRKSKAERFTGLTIGQIADTAANMFIARYSTDAERIAQLVLEKIRANSRCRK